MTIRKYHVKAIDRRDDGDVLLFEEICPTYLLSKVVLEAHDYASNMDGTVRVIGTLEVTVNVINLKENHRKLKTGAK